MLKLSVGRFLKELLDDFSTIGGVPLQIYSGHDSTVMPTLAAFGVNDHGWPPYASTVVFEVGFQTSKDQDVVRLLFNDQVLINWTPLVDIAAQIRPYVLTPDMDYTKLCEKRGEVDFPSRQL